MLSEVILPVLSAVRNSFKGPNQSPIEVLVLGSFYFEKKENIMFKMMKFKTLAILVTLTFLFHNFGYTHSGRTDASGCHRNTATGTRHCHSGGTSSGGTSSSSRSDAYSHYDEGGMTILGIVVVVVVVYCYWGYTTDWGKNPQGCCLLNSEHRPKPAYHFLNQKSVLAPGSSFMFPSLELDKEVNSGWRVRATYTFRF